MDLRNPCALQKIRRIYRILSLFKKSGRYTESLRITKNQAELQNPYALQKNRRMIESLQALKFPRLLRNQQDWKKLVARLLFRLGEISSC